MTLVSEFRIWITSRSDLNNRREEEIILHEKKLRKCEDSNWKDSLVTADGSKFIGSDNRTCNKLNYEDLISSSS